MVISKNFWGFVNLLDALLKLTIVFVKEKEKKVLKWQLAKCSIWKMFKSVSLLVCMVLVGALDLYILFFSFLCFCFLLLILIHEASIVFSLFFPPFLCLQMEREREEHLQPRLHLQEIKEPTPVVAADVSPDESDSDPEPLMHVATHHSPPPQPAEPAPRSRKQSPSLSTSPISTDSRISAPGRKDTCTVVIRMVLLHQCC